MISYKSGTVLSRIYKPVLLRKINALIKDIQRTPYEGIGKPEPIKFDLAGLWSRRIDLDHRLVYRVDDSDILIFACRFHYAKK